MYTLSKIAEQLNGMKMVKTTPFNILDTRISRFSKTDLTKAVLEPKMRNVDKSAESCKNDAESWFGQLFQV